MPDIQADLAYAVEDFSNTYGPAWLWNILSTDSDVESVYAGLYAIISRCNFFLERVDAVKQQETDVDNIEYLDMYTGEVYTIRALCYSETHRVLLQGLRPRYGRERTRCRAAFEILRVRAHKACLAQGLPTSSFSTTSATPRSLLDNDNDQYNTIYATAAAAQALHARVALYMQDFETAIEYATKVIDNKAGIELTNVEIISGTTTYLAYMWGI